MLDRDNSLRNDTSSGCAHFFQEFLYPIMQGYDSVAIAKNTEHVTWNLVEMTSISISLLAVHLCAQSSETGYYDIRAFGWKTDGKNEQKH